MKKIAALVLIGLLALAGCGSSGTKHQTLTVLTASSLTKSFHQLAPIYEKDNPGVKVKLVSGASATVAQDAIQGLPGGILATSDKTSMDKAVTAGSISGSATEFAKSGANTYWVAVTTTVKHPNLAKAWVKLLASSQGQAVLSKAGFTKP